MFAGFQVMPNRRIAEDDECDAAADCHGPVTSHRPGRRTAGSRGHEQRACLVWILRAEAPAGLMFRATREHASPVKG
jgi:hypothetical protein